MEAPLEYEAPHIECLPCPTCTGDLGHPVYHPMDRPCTISLLRIPTP